MTKINMGMLKASVNDTEIYRLGGYGFGNYSAPSVNIDKTFEDQGMIR